MSKICKSKPAKMLVSKGRERYYLTVAMNVNEVEGGYEADVYTVTIDKAPSYESLINALVRMKYPQDEMEAIVNNYLLDMTDEDARMKFTAMQAWRKEVKSFAKSVYKEEEKEVTDEA